MNSARTTFRKDGSPFFMKKKRLSKKEKIKLRLEFYDVIVKECRRRIELGEPIPSIKVLIQPR